MSVIINKMSVAKPVIVELANMPLDARTRCNNVDDFPNIETPFVGMLIYTIDDGKFWVVTKLKAKLIGSMSVENMQIDEYAEFVGGSGGGGEYTAGEGISIANGAISVNFNIVAKKADIKSYSAGTGINISSAGVISCTVTPKDPIEYTAGSGLLLVGSEFEVDFETVAKKGDIKSYSAGEGLSLNGTTFSVDWAKVAKAADIVTYHAGVGISIVNGVINCTLTPEDPIEYSAGEGITISNTDVISVDWTKVAKAADIKSYSAGDGLSLNGTVFSVDWTAVAKKADIKTYSNGEGLSLNGTTFSVDWTAVAKKADIVNYTAGTGIDITNGVISCTIAPEDPIEYSAGEGLSLNGTEFAVDFDVVAKKSDIPDGTSDYNELKNKPIIAAGEGVNVDIIKGGSLIVSGAGDTDTNGTYEMVDQAAEGTARVWQKEGRKLYNDGTKWIFDDDTDNASFYYSSTGTADPWGATFTAALSSLGNPPTVAQVSNGMQDKITVSIEDIIGDLNEILDEINGEVI